MILRFVGFAKNSPAASLCMWLLLSRTAHLACCSLFLLLFSLSLFPFLPLRSFSHHLLLSGVSPFNPYVLRDFEISCVSMDSVAERPAIDRKSCACVYHSLSFSRRVNWLRVCRVIIIVVVVLDIVIVVIIVIIVVVVVVVVFASSSSLLLSLPSSSVVSVVLVALVDLVVLIIVVAVVVVVERANQQWFRSVVRLFRDTLLARPCAKERREKAAGVRVRAVISLGERRPDGTNEPTVRIYMRRRCSPFHLTYQLPETILWIDRRILRGWM